MHAVDLDLEIIVLFNNVVGGGRYGGALERFFGERSRMSRPVVVLGFARSKLG
jgi:hypothetical protein